MKDSILEKFFIGYISFAILGMLIITYWSTNITYNHLVETTASQLYNYATVASKNIADDCKYSISDITDFEPYVEDFNKVLNAEVWILGSDFNLKYSSDGSDLNSDSSKSIIISNFGSTPSRIILRTGSGFEKNSPSTLRTSMPCT